MDVGKRKSSRTCKEKREEEREKREVEGGGALKGNQGGREVEKEERVKRKRS